MDRNVNVLISSCGRRVELVRAFKAARDRMSVSGNVVCSDASDDAPALYYADKTYSVPRISSDGFISAIIDICVKENINLIIPTIDTELVKFAENKLLIESATNAKVLISDINCINICRDKIKTAQFFADNNFAFPYTYSLNELDSANYKLPLFIKPKDGSSSINAFKVNTSAELDFFRNYVVNPIVQECIGGIEYTVDIFLDFNSNIISCLPRKRLATRSGEILKGEIDMNYTVIQDVKRLMHFLNPIGHITVQGFLGEDNVFRFIEVNPRFGGGAPMAIKAGADSCEWLYKLLLGEPIGDISIKNKAIYSRFDDCVEII